MNFDKIVAIISDKMDIDADQIKMDSTFETLKLDSLDMVEVIMDLEEEFDVSIEASEDMKTVGDLVKYIEENQK